MNNFYKFESNERLYYYFSVVDKSIVGNEFESLSIDLFITDCSKYFSAKLQNDFLLHFSNKFNFRKQDFYSLTHDTFTGKNESGIELNISKYKGVENFTLIWKQDLSISKNKILAGNIELAVIPSQSFYVNLLQITMLNNAKVEELSKELDTLKQQYEIIKQKTNELIGIKDSIEKDLYSKFVLLLNSKKEKIRKLKSELDALKKEDSVEKTTKKIKVKKQSKKKNKIKIGKAEVDEKNSIESVNYNEEDSSQSDNNSSQQTQTFKRKSNIQDEDIYTRQTQESNLSLVFDDTTDDRIDGNNPCNDDQSDKLLTKKNIYDDDDASNFLDSIMDERYNRLNIDKTKMQKLEKSNSIYNQETVDLMDELI